MASINNDYIVLSPKEFQDILTKYQELYDNKKVKNKIDYGVWRRLRLQEHKVKIKRGITPQGAYVEIIDAFGDRIGPFPVTTDFGEMLYNLFFIKEREQNIIKEDVNMKGFNFDFGPCTNDNVRMSMYGLAVKNSADIWVSYNKGQIVDVDVFNFDGRQYMFKMPVAIKDIAVGDIVIHNHVPMFVTSVENGSISAVDVRAGESKTIIPTTNMFGFNFVTKIVSMFNAFSGMPTADQPFGNMLPFLMMGEDKDIDPIMLMLMMNGNKDMNMMNNPMMFYFLANKGDKENNWMLPMMMMNMNNNK